MDKRSLPENDHFARHCTPGMFSDEEDNERMPPWLKGKAFEPTISNPILSGLWPEYHKGDWQARLTAIRKELRDGGRTVKPSHKLAILRVQKIKAIGNDRGKKLDAIHKPLKNMPSHSEIIGELLEDRRLHQKLADAPRSTRLSRPANDDGPHTCRAQNGEVEFRTRLASVADDGLEAPAGGSPWSRRSTRWRSSMRARGREFKLSLMLPCVSATLVRLAPEDGAALPDRRGRGAERGI